MAANYLKLSEDGKTITVTLKYPVTHNKETIAAITMRMEVTGADLEEQDRANGSTARVLRIVSELATEPADLSLTALRKLRAVDVGRVAEAVAEALGN